MTYRSPHAAPASAVPEERRGAVVGRFCRACASIYRIHSPAHRGKPVYGKDHVSAPCSHEGELFAAEQAWWEPAVELLPAPPVEAVPVSDGD